MQLAQVCSAAIWGGNINTVKAFLDEELLESGVVDVNKPSESGRTLLSFAAATGRKDLVKILIERGTKTDIADNDGLFPSDHIPSEITVMPNYLRLELLELLKRS